MGNKFYLNVDYSFEKVLKSEFGMRSDFARATNLYYAKLASLDSRLSKDHDGFFFVKPALIERDINLNRLAQFRYRKKLQELGIIATKESGGGHNNPTGIKIIRPYC
jgi:hypothetical protein